MNMHGYCFTFKMLNSSFTQLHARMIQYNPVYDYNITENMLMFCYVLCSSQVKVTSRANVRSCESGIIGTLNLNLDLFTITLIQYVEHLSRFFMIILTKPFYLNVFNIDHEFIEQSSYMLKEQDKLSDIE